VTLGPRARSSPLAARGARRLEFRLTLDELEELTERSPLRIQLAELLGRFGVARFSGVELDALAQGSDKLPYLPPAALTRESFYQDHD